MSHEVNVSQSVEKRHSMLEDPDTGEVWPDGFDAITVLQREKRLFKAKEARRFIDYFFHHGIGTRSGDLKGVVLHYQDNEHEACVMFDTNMPYMQARFVVVKLLGSRTYGYRASEGLDVLQHDRGCVVLKDNLLTYFRVPVEFEPVQGEVLGMMVAEARDEALRTRTLRVRR
jgi:hypothetical protein